MKVMICMRGELDQLPFLPEIAELGAGVELGSYGLIGVRSEADWQRRLEMHGEVRARFSGPLALHGPFLGMSYAHIDHLIQATVKRRMDMALDAALQLNASRVVLHAGFSLDLEAFNLHDMWLQGNIAFWKSEISRWRDAGVQIVLENDVERSPDLLVQLVEAVNDPFLGLCMDIGHQHMFSQIDAAEWVRRMDKRLLHVHLHDNDRTGDKHWSIGRGTVDFEGFYRALKRHVPQVTLSLESEDLFQTKMADLHKLVQTVGEMGD